MALSKLLLASLLLSLLLLHDLVDADQAVQESVMQTPGSVLQQIDCKGACSARCRLASRQRMCKRACGTCCRRCNCVPPGTAGNQEVCPCYYNMTTHGGRRKCP
ncbi:snakin-2 [Neltuma alba]|uniref:snakin-2-like n=1 Tax=Neltuma alba TaxID=207710 RepID=UPI0010A47B35|nr:snakin-2-like [Prosopis alba]XP_028792930.1 snakin-2-like [Prosopis alba]